MRPSSFDLSTCFASTGPRSNPSILCFAFLTFSTISGNLLLARSKPRHHNWIGFWHSFGTADSLGEFEHKQEKRLAYSPTHSRVTARPHCNMMEITLAYLAGTAKSSLPFPLKSPTATPWGTKPVPNRTPRGWKVPSPLPNSNVTEFEPPRAT